MASSYVNLLEQKKAFTLERLFSLIGLIWFTNMVTILMFWLTNSSFMLMIHLSIWQASQSEIQAQLTSGLTNVLSWLHDNFLILDLEKTKIMLIGTHQGTTEADDLVKEISHMHLERVNWLKYFLVLLENTLTWKDHIEYIGKKISSRLGVLR